MPKIVDHEQAHIEIVERSTALFAEQGYARLTMRTIAAALKVSTGALYHYFANKEALFDAVVDSVIDGEVANVERAASVAPPLLADRFRIFWAFVGMRLRSLEQQSMVCMEYLRANEDPEVKARIHARTRAAREHYTRAAAGFFGFDDPAWADLVVLVVNGAVLRSLLSGTSLAELEGIGALERLIEGALARREAGDAAS